MHVVSELKVSPVLPVEPGLCGLCGHASVKATGRGTAYLRCTRASWDDRLVKYPRLPVVGCAGFAPADGGAQPADGGAQPADGGADGEDQAPGG
jgi:hypothetical protein